MVLEWEWTILCSVWNTKSFLSSVFIVEFSGCITGFNYKHCRHFWGIYCIRHLICALQPSRSWRVPPNRYLFTISTWFYIHNFNRLLLGYHVVNGLSHTIFNSFVSIAEYNKIWKTENNNSRLPLPVCGRQFKYLRVMRKTSDRGSREVTCLILLVMLKVFSSFHIRIFFYIS